MNKRIWTVDLTILTLGAACAVLAGMLAAVKPMLLVVVVPVLAVMGLLLFWNVKALRRRMAKASARQRREGAVHLCKPGDACGSGVRRKHRVV